GFNSRLDQDIGTRSTRHRTPDQQQILVGINPNHFKRLNRHTLVTELTGHLLTLEYASRALILTNGTRCTMGQGVTMGCVLCAEIPTLDYTSKALTFGLTSDIHQLTCLKQGQRDLLANFLISQLRCFSAELPLTTTCLHTRLREVTCSRLGNTGCFAGTGRDLHSTVAVGLEGFDLGDQVGLNLDHSNRNSTTIVHEQACHSDLAANHTNCHIFTSRVRGFHPLWPLDVVTPGVMCSRL